MFCVGLLACDTGSDSNAAGSRAATGAYGEEIIGYKLAPVEQVAVAANNPPRAAGEPPAPGAPINASTSSGGGQAPIATPAPLDSPDESSEPEPEELSEADDPAPDPIVPVPAPSTPSEAGAHLEAGVPSEGGVPTQVEGGTSPEAGVPTSSEPPIVNEAGVELDLGDAGVRAPLRCDIPEFEDIPVLERQVENPFRVAEEMPASTFSIDVDTGSYTLARAAINAGALPARQSVRIEEFINYFHLHYGQPEGDLPFSIYTELADCPWNPDNKLLMVGVQGQEVPLEDQPPANLVFLLDVSGSMGEAGKLPLLKQGFRMITKQLRDVDTVSIVTYSTTVNLALAATPGSDKQTILAAIEALYANGSTAGEAGVQLAYDVAQQHFIRGGNNRVLLATDGDFNVGINTTAELTQFIAEKRDTGVFLSVYGFGSPSGNFQDELAEQLADNGNGIYFFVDSQDEARRAFVHTLTGSLLTVAKDVKLQLQFNAGQVKGYRLVGYENRVLSNADFSNDSVDAGDLGAGLSVTSFFEIIPADSDNDVPEPQPGTDPLDDIASAADDAELTAVTGADLVEVRVRYKGAEADLSNLITKRVNAEDAERGEPSLKFSFASGVAEWAMQLRGSQYLPARRDLELLDQISLALPADREGAVKELLDLAGGSYEL
jgi:Ca-activated chloride channel family protein